ncbi:hypothetical protein G7054_g10146 [Neopestalotiopsis clavispora]|nr:hypothetical protein G7054_g10146 [Neopestalotiopsis clavispora]
MPDKVDHPKTPLSKGGVEKSTPARRSGGRSGSRSRRSSNRLPVSAGIQEAVARMDAEKAARTEERQKASRARQANKARAIQESSKSNTPVVASAPLRTASATQPGLGQVPSSSGSGQLEAPHAPGIHLPVTPVNRGQSSSRKDVSIGSIPTTYNSSRDSHGSSIVMSPGSPLQYKSQKMTDAVTPRGSRLNPEATSSASTPKETQRLNKTASSTPLPVLDLTNATDSDSDLSMSQAPSPSIATSPTRRSSGVPVDLKGKAVLRDSTRSTSERTQRQQHNLPSKPGETVDLTFLSDTDSDNLLSADPSPQPGSSQRIPNAGRTTPDAGVERDTKCETCIRSGVHRKSDGKCTFAFDSQGNVLDKCSRCTERKISCETVHPEIKVLADEFFSIADKDAQKPVRSKLIKALKDFGN